MLTGRSAEQEKLLEFYYSSSAEFAVVWGIALPQLM